MPANSLEEDGHRFGAEPRAEYGPVGTLAEPEGFDPGGQATPGRSQRPAAPRRVATRIRNEGSNTNARERLAEPEGFEPSIRLYKRITV